MAKNDISQAGEFTVTNTEKRPRRVGAHRFPGKSGGTPSTVTVRLSPREHLQVRTCKSLEVAPVGKAKASKPAADQGDGLDKLKVDELDALLEEAELDTDGNKAEKVARLREHRDQSGD